jgi:hypothetical protein
VVPTTLLALGSVYGQFHYAVDALSGLGVGSAAAAGGWLASRQTAAVARVDPGHCHAPEPAVPSVDGPENLPSWTRAASNRRGTSDRS